MQKGWPSKHCSYLSLLPGGYRAGAAQALKQSVGRVAIGKQPFLLLEFDDRQAHGLAETPCGLARLETLGLDERGQLLSFRLRKWERVGRPSAHEVVAAADAIGQMGDGQRIGIRIIVALDHIEIPGDEE